MSTAAITSRSATEAPHMDSDATDQISGRMSLAHLTVLDTTPPELVSVAAAAGFRNIGIRLTATPSVGIPPYDILSDGPLLRETLLRLADTGISVLDTEFLRFEPEHLVGVPEGFLEVSARLGAKNVLVMSAEPHETRTVERFCELSDRAAAYGLQVCLEFAIYTGVRTLAHAVRVVARSKRPNASVLVDALHFSRSGGLPAHVAEVDPALLRYAQICDASANMPGPGDAPALIREARTGRLLPGEGVLPLAELVAALPPGAPLAIEAPCRSTADLSALERATRAHRALAALLERAPNGPRPGVGG
jgi:sugar phosphate isomerase/epimerase